MGERVDLFKKMFKYAGVFHWKNFVATAKEWGDQRGFTVLETIFKEKVPEIELTLLGERKRDEYLADYFTFEIHLWAVRDMPEKGYIEARGEFLVRAWVETGYEDVYGKRPMREGWLGKLDDFFKEHVLKSRLDIAHYDPYYNEMINFTRTMQHAIGMDLALTREEET